MCYHWPYLVNRDAICFNLFLICFVRPDLFFRPDRSDKTFAVTKIIKVKEHLPVKMSKFAPDVIHSIWLRVLCQMFSTSELTGDEKQQIIRSTEAQNWHSFFQKVKVVWIDGYHLTFESSRRTWSKDESRFNPRHIHSWYLRHSVL